LYEASAELTPWTRRCVRQADRVLIIANAGDDPAPGRLETALLSPRPAHAAPGLELLLLHPDKSRPPARTERWLAPRQVAQHHHLARNTPAEFDRLARFLTGRAIGIVFSGGVFRGFAHGGVIKALQEVGLRPDFVGGTSIGAAIGALYALDWPFEKILARGKGFAAKARSYADLTLPLVSMISSRRLNRLSQELFGDTRIEDMWTPYFCVSSNLSRATMMVHRRGLLWRSVRASFALPTLLPPVTDGGDILVDGSLFDNLPAETMRQLCRDGPVIAVNVSPKKDLTRRYHFDAGLSGGQLLWSRLNPFAQEIKAPSLLTTVMRTIVVGRDESWPQAARDIDLYLEPPVVQYDFGDAGSLEYIIQASYEFARPKLMAWKGLLQARGLLA
ncbi:MAG: patatin-like phospholipase family protein, partial [Anaerolineae bacterium]